MMAVTLMACYGMPPCGEPATTDGDGDGYQATCEGYGRGGLRRRQSGHPRRDGRGGSDSIDPGLQQRRFTLGTGSAGGTGGRGGAGGAS